MKNRLSLFVATLATLFVTLTASAQGEWKWAHYWTGGDGSYGDYYNKIINTAFDDEGNIYVYGTMGGSPKYDENTLQFTTNAQVLNSNRQSILLAKFDTLGNMLWYKIVKSSGNPANPNWMEVRDNQIHISGDVEMEYVDHNWNNVWLYYLDTLIRGAQVHAIPVENRKPPYMTGFWTFFATLNADGELLQDHFVELHSRERYLINGVYYRNILPLCMLSGNNPSPVHTDSQGNIYVYTSIQYAGSESDPLTIVVDGDSNKIYDLFLPGDVDSNLSNAYINNAMLFKFSPNGELIFYKLIVNHTEGIASNYLVNGDSVNKYFTCSFSGISYDEEDNMYLTGHLQLERWINGQGGETHQYPVRFWWDSSHCVTMNDISSAEACNFIVKYNTSGDMDWSNQIYSVGTQSSSTGFARASWHMNNYYDNAVYVLGGAAYTKDLALIYFDDENHPLHRYTDQQTDICFFVKYDKFNGSYISQGIVPSTDAVASLSPSIVNNRVFALSKYSTSGYGYLLSEWKNDGTFIEADTLFSSEAIQLSKSVGPTVSENGHVVLVACATSPVTFGNNIFADCPSGHSSAVVAFYHNPEFAQPFVPDDSVGIDEYYQNREREIYLYPNPTSGEAVVCGYMYGYRSIELLDLQGRRLATLLDSPHGTSLPEIDLSPYPSGTYLVKINFERGVSVVRKIVRS